MKDEIKEIVQFDANLAKKLEDFMEAYKMTDVEQIYSNGIEFVPIYRVKQWLEYNNITNLQERIDKAIEYLKSNEWGKDYELSYCRTHLLNILQGEDNE
jgi:hypothetical protein